MSSKVKCTCGWSWNKSDSSKKDMYVCHQCGKDNTMKDGGWLNKFQDGGEETYGTYELPEVVVTPSSDINKDNYSSSRESISPRYTNTLLDKVGGAYRNFIHSRPIENIKDVAPLIKLFDPSGVSNYPDLYNAIKSGNSDDIAIETFASLPLAGKAGQYVNYLDAAIKGKKFGLPIFKTARYTTSGISSAKDIGQTIKKKENGGWLSKFDVPEAQLGKVVSDNTTVKKPIVQNIIGLTKDPDVIKYNKIKNDEQWGDPYKFLMNWYADPETKKRIKEQDAPAKPMTNALNQKLYNNYLDWYSDSWDKNIKEAKDIWGDDYSRAMGLSDQLNEGLGAKYKDLRENTYGVHFPKQSIIALNSDLFGISKELMNSTAVHELTHATPLDDFYTDYFKKNKPKNPKESEKKYFSENPDEIYPRIQELRYQMWRDKKIAPGTKVTPSLLEGYSNDNSMDLKKYFSPEELSKIMNEIAYEPNNKKPTPQAQNGIEGTMGGLTDKGFNYNGAWGGTMAMGGSLPGSVGFSYARTQGAAPANGKYTKKTKASAENGKEMKFWQEGLDWKPKTISKDGSVIEDDRGQWAYPGEITKINSNQITMQGVDYPVLGISDTGDTQMMQPGQDYTYEGKSVTEYPMMQDGGWLDKFQDGGEKTYGTYQLPEVVVTPEPEEEGFWKQSIKSYLDENKDAGFLGALGSVVTYPLGLPQQAMMYGLTGKVQKPSESLGINNRLGALATDIIVDPTNLLGVGIADDALKLSGKVGKLFKEEKLLSKANKSKILLPNPNKVKLKNYVSPIKNNDDKIYHQLDMGELGKDYTKILPNNSAYNKWADEIYPGLSELISPEQLKAAHEKSIDYFKNSTVTGYGGKEHGLFIRNLFSDIIPQFRFPVVKNPKGHQVTQYLNAMIDEVGTLTKTANFIESDPAIQNLLTKSGYDTSKLTPQDWNIIDAYTKGYDNSINSLLRGKNRLGLPIEGTKEFYNTQADLLKESVLKNKAKEPFQVRRGVGNYYVELLDPKTYQPLNKKVTRSELQKDDIFKDESFLSTELDTENSSGFGDYHSSEIIDIPGGNVQSIAIPEASSYPQFAGEREIILPPGLIRRVEETDLPGSVRFRTSILNPYSLTGILGGTAAASSNLKQKKDGGWLSKYN